MRRPIGIYIAGIILLVTGLLGLVTASLGVLGAVSVQSPQPMFPHFEAVVLVVAGLFGLFCVFLGWVAIDLFRMRIWARYATIALAALGACYSGFSAVMAFFMQYVMPPNPNLRPELMHRVFDVFAVLYLVLAAIAIFWVIYFNRKTVRAAFQPAAATIPATFTGGVVQGAVEGISLPAQPVHRSLSAEEIILKAFGVLLLIGGVSMIFLVLMGMPLVLFGWTLTGKAALLADLLLTAINIYAGLGLILRWRSGWLLAFAMELFALVIISLNFIPSFAARTMAASRTFSMRLMPGAPPAPMYPHLMLVTFAFSDLVVLAILVILIRARRSYLS